jgi:hypothetical protein
MIKLLVFLGLNVLAWIFILLFITKMSIKVGTQPSKVRSVVVMVSNGFLFSLSILSVIYNIATLHICGVIWLWVFPILVGDIYYAKKDYKTSHKEIEERNKVLDSVLRSLEEKCNKAGIESGVKIEDITK